MLLNGLGVGIVYLFTDQKLLLYFFCFLIIVSLINLLNILVWMPSKAKKVFGQHKDLQRPYGIEVLEQGIRETNINGERTIPWVDFHEWREDDGYLMLYVSSIIFLTIPKRFVEDQKTIEQIKQNLTQFGVSKTNVT